MISIIKANENDYQSIVNIGRVAVEEAHRESCSAKDMSEYIAKNYNEAAIKDEFKDAKNIYQIIHFNEIAVGFSKIVLNAEHSNIRQKNVTKLDRIYLLKEYHNHKLGFRLLKYNIELSKNADEAGMWLYTWVENNRAIHFYLKMGFTIIGEHQFKVTDSCSNLNHHMYLAY